MRVVLLQSCRRICFISLFCRVFVTILIQTKTSKSKRIEHAIISSTVQNYVRLKELQIEYVHLLFAFQAGAAGLNPVFCSLEIKQLNKNMTAFFFVFNASSQSYHISGYLLIKILRTILKTLLNKPISRPGRK